MKPKMQQVDENYRLLFERNPDGVFSLDPNGRFILVNPACEAISGYPIAELLGKTFMELCAPDCLTTAVSTFFEGIKSRSYTQIEITMIRKGGRRIDLLISGEPFYQDDKIATIYCTAKDITERKRMEDELRRSRDQLELRVRERTSEIAQRVQTIHEQSEQLRRVTAQLAIAEQRERRRIAQILHDGLQQTLVGAKYRLALAERSSNPQDSLVQATDLIDEAIEISRSLSSELSPPILIQGDLMSALEWLSRWMKDKYNLTVSITIREKVHLPEEALLLLFQAARELLFNAARHAGIKSAQINIDRAEGFLHMQVIDNGSGFDPKLLNEGRCDGMGLLVLQERFSYLGGNFEIESVPGQGSRFLLKLPLTTAAEIMQKSAEKKLEPLSPASPQLNLRPAAAIKKIRLMLVDDHKAMRQGLAALISGEPDFEVVAEASDGEDAVKLAREIWPDVILMDIGMPKMDGIQATRIIHQEFPGIRIIGFSMYKEMEQESSMRKAGAVDYLTKSGPSEALVNAIRGESSRAI